MKTKFTGKIPVSHQEQPGDVHTDDQSRGNTADGDSDGLKNKPGQTNPSQNSPEQGEFTTDIPGSDVPPDEQYPGHSQFYSCLQYNPNITPIRVDVYKIPKDVVVGAPKGYQYDTQREYDIAANAYKVLTNYMDQMINTIEPFSKFCMTHFDVAPREFEEGFPKNDRSGTIVYEHTWFAFNATAYIKLNQIGEYKFKTMSDDGTIFYIENGQVINHDGMHPPTWSDEHTYINSSAGKKVMHMHYFQGPPLHIALQLFWKKPGASAFEIVPRSAFEYIP